MDGLGQLELELQAQGPPYRTLSLSRLVIRIVQRHVARVAINIVTLSLDRNGSGCGGGAKAGPAGILGPGDI